MKTSSQITVQITADQVGLRLDKFLSTLDEINSRSFAQDLIEKNLVSVNNKTVKPSYILVLNDQVSITFPPIQDSKLVPYDYKLDIIFEDDDLIVVNKASGLVVHPAAGHQQDTLVNALLYYTKQLSMKNEQRPGIVHRIDKDTSGLLVVAKNDFTHEKLAEQFKNKSVHRIYYALVKGALLRTTGTCKSYLARHPVDRKRHASLRENNKVINTFAGDLPHAKWAVTQFTKIAQQAHMSYLKLQLETGRTHQIRVHLSELGHPLVGDVTYGFSAKKMSDLGVARFFLHAAELGFIHPRTTRHIQFKVDWPAEDLKKLVEFGFDPKYLSK